MPPYPGAGQDVPGDNSFGASEWDGHGTIPWIASDANTAMIGLRNRLRDPTGKLQSSMLMMKI
jgi:hypothetical protein